MAACFFGESTVGGVVNLTISGDVGGFEADPEVDVEVGLDGDAGALEGLFFELALDLAEGLFEVLGDAFLSLAFSRYSSISFLHVDRCSSGSQVFWLDGNPTHFTWNLRTPFSVLIPTIFSTIYCLRRVLGLTTGFRFAGTFLVFVPVIAPRFGMMIACFTSIVDACKFEEDDDDGEFEDDDGEMVLSEGWVLIGSCLTSPLAINRCTNDWNRTNFLIESILAAWRGFLNGPSSISTKFVDANGSQFD